MIANAIETTVWEPDEPARPLRYVRTKTVGEVFEELVAALGGRGEYGVMADVDCDEYFVVAYGVDREGRWPDGRIAVFPVEGSSEGDYVHVEVLNGEKRQLLLLGKTFAGRDAAWRFARRVADALGA